MEKDTDFPAKVHSVKRVSALYQLPYWRVSALMLTHSMQFLFIFITLYMEHRWLLFLFVILICTFDNVACSHHRMSIS